MMGARNVGHALMVITRTPGLDLKLSCHGVKLFSFMHHMHFLEAFPAECCRLATMAKNLGARMRQYHLPPSRKLTLHRMGLGRTMKERSGHRKRALSSVAICCLGGSHRVM